MKKVGALAVALLGAVTLGACGGGDDSGAMLDELGDGEGAVNLVAWAGYV
ncbi:MAG: spermidine/putrescine ABC transporter substrate-binding protein, partial [Actinobacteria bacterium]|nr:spermidine/putrescine ABC transporter substrate-binding protein [Actinomycetota bacterium]